MQVESYIKGYFLKVAIPFVIFVALLESAFEPQSYLGNTLAHLVRAGKAQLYFHERGGQRESP